MTLLGWSPSPSPSHKLWQSNWFSYPDGSPGNPDYPLFPFGTFSIYCLLSTIHLFLLQRSQQDTDCGTIVFPSNLHFRLLSVSIQVFMPLQSYVKRGTRMLCLRGCNIAGVCGCLCLTELSLPFGYLYISLLYLSEKHKLVKSVLVCRFHTLFLLYLVTGRLITLYL